MLVRLLVAALLLSACGGSTPVAVATASPHAPGPLADTWLGHDSTWRQLQGLHPSPRYAAALAYDAARNDFVLFGGQSKSVSFDETWTFAGSTWKLQSPAHKPAARRDATMAYDPALRLVVLYGGLVQAGAEGSEVGDTWTWDGSDWTLVSLDNDGPHHRYGAKMVTAKDGVIMFGGHVFNTAYFGDTWSFDGSVWTRVDHSAGPAGRSDAAVAWDEEDSSLLVSGGLGIRPDAGPGNLGLPLNDAWSLKAATWSHLTAAGPQALFNASAVWDAGTHSVVVMLGMICPQPVNDAWAWNGTVWTESKVPIPARWSAATVADTKGNVLVFGGDDEAGC